MLDKTIEDNDKKELHSENEYVSVPSDIPKKKPGRKPGTESKVRLSAVTAPMGAPLNDNSRANLPTRIRISDQDRLAFYKRPGFVARVVSYEKEYVDKTGNITADDNIARHLKAGYTVVHDENLSTGSKSNNDTPFGSVRRRSLGGGRYGILMEIPEKYWQEDRQYNTKKNNEVLQAHQQGSQDDNLKKGLQNKEIYTKNFTMNKSDKPFS